ncbi:MAG: hypothetical protein ACOC42_02440 [Halobacteriota archaeon]
MGRTNPTYRDLVRRYETALQPYRRGLRAADQAHFDRLFDRAREHADAATYQNATDPETMLLLSMLLAHERALRELQAED